MRANLPGVGSDPFMYLSTWGSMRELERPWGTWKWDPEIQSSLYTGADTRGEPGGAGVPLELWGRGQGKATIGINNCQNSLYTRLKYIRITLKVDFYKTKSGSGPHRVFFSERGQKMFCASRAKSQKKDYFRGGGGKIFRTLRAKIY